MKCLKSVLAVLLAVWMVLGGCLSVGAVPEDVKGTGYEEAVQVLTALKIMKSADDGNFQLESPVSRGELTDIIVRMFDLSEEQGFSTEKCVFKDVYDGHTYNASIETARKIGIVSGDAEGNFRPDEQATYEQTVKMIITALGYDSYAISKGGYPVGYLTMAAQLGITDGVQGEVEKGVNKGSVAKMVYNALDVDLMQQTSFGGEGEFTVVKGENLLTEKLKVRKEQGRVTALGETNIYGKKTHQEGEIEIDRVAYKIGDCDVSGLLGYQVVFFTKEEQKSDVKTLVTIWKDSKQKPIVDVPADQICADTTKSVFRYYPDKDKIKDVKEVSIDKNADVVYDQIAYSKADKIADNDLKPTSGKVVLFDTDDNGQFDVVLITSYDICVVDGISVSEKTISLKNKSLKYNSTSLDLDRDSADKKVVYYLDQEESDLSKIKTWDVLAIEESKDESLITVHIVRNKVDGTVNEASDDDIKIEETWYKKSSGLTDNTGAARDISINSTGSFYLDIEGKVAAYDKKNSTGLVYGYLKDACAVTGVSDRGQFKIFGTDGKWIILNSADKILYNNTSVTGSDVADALKDKPQLIKYRLNDNGVIKEIQTYTNKAVANGDFDPKNYPGYDVNGQFTLDYKDTGATFWDPMIASRYFVASDTIVFLIPTNRELTKAYAASKGKDRLDHNSNAHDIEIYDSTIDKIPKVIVRYTGDASGGKTKLNLGSKGAIFVVDHVSTFINSDGDSTCKLYGFRNGAAATVEVDPDGMVDPTASTSTSAFRHPGFEAQNLQKGDIIIYAANSLGKADNMVVLYRASSPPKDGKSYVEECAQSGELTQSCYHSEYYFAFGKALRVGSKSVFYNANADGNDHTYDRSAFLESAKIYLYDRDKGKVSVAKATDIAPGDTLFIRLHFTRIQQDIVIIRDSHLKSTLPVSTSN